MTTLEETIKELKKRPLTSVSNDTGFSYQWLWLLKKGRIKNPSVNKVEELYTYLKHELPDTRNS